MKKIYKYGTGEAIPKNAIYLCTLVEETTDNTPSPRKMRLVWHYFLVEMEATP